MFVNGSSSFESDSLFEAMDLVERLQYRCNVGPLM